MRRKLLPAVLFFLCLLPPLQPARALTTVQNADGTDKTIMDYIKDYVDIPAGATDWKVFGATKETEAHSKTPDGYDNLYSKPEFQPALKALDGKTVTVKGFMFPLDGTDLQKHFLFGPFPATCPFQYHVGPPLVIEVDAGTHPVKFSYDPVVITGTLELIPDDPDYSTFYKLHDARQVTN